MEVAAFGVSTVGECEENIVAYMFSSAARSRREFSVPCLGVRMVILGASMGSSWLHLVVWGLSRGCGSWKVRLDLNQNGKMVVYTLRKGRGNPTTAVQDKIEGD